MEQKPHSQKDRQDEKAEGYVPDEGKELKKIRENKENMVQGNYEQGRGKRK